MFRAATLIIRMTPLRNFLATHCSPHVKHTLAHVDLRGVYILDSCGSKVDAVYRVLTDEGLHVLTNDINGRLTADTHLDVLKSEFLQEYVVLWQRSSQPPFSGGSVCGVIITAGIN